MRALTDVMLYGFALLGTVTGYYFGRVPAERRAEAADLHAGEARHTAETAVNASATANETARQAQQQHDAASKKLAEAKAGIERAKAALATAAPAPGGGLRRSRDFGPLLDLRTGEGEKTAQPAPAADATAEAYMELEVLSRLL